MTPYRPRLYLLVEGQTEEAFANDVLIPHLATRGIDVFVQAVLTSRSHRSKGGGKWAHYKNHLARWMGQNSGPECSFSLVMDLYGRPKDLPSVPVGQSGAALARAIEESISRDIGDRRLIPYLQCHEFEALLFSDLSVLAPLVEERDRAAFAALQASTAHLAPETIDDGPETAPSKRLSAAIHNYDKVTHGSLGVSTLGIERIRARCPHFARWLQSLEELPLTPVWTDLHRLATASGIDVARAREHVGAVHTAVLERGESWSLPVLSSGSSQLVLLWLEDARSLQVAFASSGDARCMMSVQGEKREEAFSQERIGQWWAWLLRGGRELP